MVSLLGIGHMIKVGVPFLGENSGPIDPKGSAGGRVRHME